MRRSCRRPSLVGGKRCRQSQYLPPAGSTSRSRPPPSETRYRRDPCGRARTSLSVRAKTPFTPPPQFYTTTYTTTIFCLPGFCRDAMGRPNSRKPTALQWVSGISGTSWEPLGIPVLSSETERVSVCNGPDRLLWDGLGRWVPPSVPSFIPSFTVCDGWTDFEAPDCRGTCLRPGTEGSGETAEPVLVGAES